MLSWSVILLLAACNSPSSEHQRNGDEERKTLERQALIERVDSLILVVDKEAERLKTQRQRAGGDAGVENELSQRLAFLEKVRSSLTTRRDEIRVDQLEEWYFFRNRVQDSLQLIEAQIKVNGQVHHPDPGE